VAEGPEADLGLARTTENEAADGAPQSADDKVFEQTTDML